MKLFGYRRKNGDIGIRNHLLVIPSVVCANNVAQKIAAQLAGAVVIPHQHGCAQFPNDAQLTHDTLAGFGTNPNVGGCIIVGLGCETVKSEKLATSIEKSQKPVGSVNIQKSGGSINAINDGVRQGKKMLNHLSALQKEVFDISELRVALECGGSDTTSGIAANPAVGIASDKVVAEGGTVILSETQELIGAEHILIEQAETTKVGDRIKEIVHEAENTALKMGFDIRSANPTPGNKEGGLSTIEEKSLGCILKAGKSRVREVLDYGSEPSKNGLLIMDTPGHDIESMTGMAAGGAHIILFTTGRGTATGCPIAPVIKITGNPETYKMMKDNIDINAGKIVTGEANLHAVGQEIYDEIFAVCQGKLTQSEQLGFADFAIHRIGPSQ